MRQMPRHALPSRTANTTLVLPQSMTQEHGLQQPLHPNSTFAAACAAPTKGAGKMKKNVVNSPVAAATNDSEAGARIERRLRRVEIHHLHDAQVIVGAHDQVSTPMMASVHMPPCTAARNT